MANVEPFTIAREDCDRARAHDTRRIKWYVLVLLTVLCLSCSLNVSLPRTTQATLPFGW